MDDGNITGNLVKQNLFITPQQEKQDVNEQLRRDNNDNVSETN